MLIVFVLYKEIKEGHDSYDFFSLNLRMNITNLLTQLIHYTVLL